jgi:hypothetical protein
VKCSRIGGIFIMIFSEPGRTQETSVWKSIRMYLTQKHVFAAVFHMSSACQVPYSSDSYVDAAGRF